MLVFTKELREAKPNLRDDFTLTQRFFDPLNRYDYDENDANV
jgi:hypothetical protein